MAWLALGALEEHVLAWKALEAMGEPNDVLGLDHHRLLSASLTSLNNNSQLSAFGLSREAAELLAWLALEAMQGCTQGSERLHALTSIIKILVAKLLGEDLGQLQEAAELLG